MTFYELEKECKKRKIRFLTGVLISVFILFLIPLIYYFNKPQKKEVKKIEKTEHKKMELPKIKVEKNITKDKNITEKITFSKPVLKQKESFYPVIELNISEIKNKKDIKKEKEPNENKREPVKRKILTINNLPSYETCIKLAKKFYYTKKYESALKWAKNANLQNKNLPESWILTAKSLYKLNKKDEAIKILKIYYKYTKDKKILKLIDRIKNDKI